MRVCVALAGLAAGSFPAQSTGTIVGRIRQGAAPVEGAVVWIADGLPTGAKYQAPRAPAVIAIPASAPKTARVVVVIAGQPLEIRNDGAAARTVTGGHAGQTFSAALPPGRSVRRYFEAGVAPWRLAVQGDTAALAWVLVLRHPFHSWTDAYGRFAIKGLPPGRYQVRVWDARRGARTGAVALLPGGTASWEVDFERR